MNMRYPHLLLSCLFLSCVCLAVRAQPASVRVELDGIPPGARRFSVVAFRDYLSLAPEFLAEKSVTGSRAELEFRLDGPRWVRVTGPYVNSDLIAVPGHTYRLALVPEGETYYVERSNAGLPASDPNIYCDSVNVLVNAYLRRHNTLLYSGRMARQTAAYCDSVQKLFTGVKSDLFQTFLGFRLAELRVLSGVWSEQAMFKMQFEGRPFRPENPDYAYAFGEFYKGRLTQAFLKNKMTHGKDLLNGFRGTDTLMKLLAAEKYYPGNEVGEGALLLGLTELLRNKDYSTDGLLYAFNRLADSSRYAPVRDLAARLYKKYKAPSYGSPAPELAIADKTDQVVQPDARRAAYVCFLDPKSEVTVSELAAMIELKKKLKEKVVLVPVIINAEKADLVRMQTSQRLTFELYRNLSVAVLADYRLKGDCTCMVLSPDGRYLQPSAPVPSDPTLGDKLLELAKTVR